jgi:excisionase family DNA binding protein
VELARVHGCFGDFQPERSEKPADDATRPPQAGALIRVGRTAIINWIRRHGLPAETLPSGRYRISREEFLSWVKQRGIGVPEVQR